MIWLLILVGAVVRSLLLCFLLNTAVSVGVG